ncbi:hypothetical protein [Shewanella sp. 6_MG-2023]|uniref:hypothetical protein n=1 Tax=Shewanella sp. 6_MG-2023 TaxID=3062660 RepID=UPI0026E465A9|nr:hypothetical protein [Shewanella sp. 6_MG-2023]MDO6620293.1 hypothetical protein [Shewanella sp. 6_MG-2023]
MRKKLVIAIIHGIGDQKVNFASDFIEKIKKQLAKLSLDSGDVIFFPIYWADIVEPRQKAYLNAAISQGSLDYRFIRRFVISALGDAGAYQKVNSSNNSTYVDIHQRISTQFESLKENGVTDNTPLMIIAHSLGGHIMSNYIWDLQHINKMGSNNFENMKTLCGIVTFGCNIPLFTFSYPQLQPITFPALEISDELKSKSKWLNFYDPDDVLGYPLKPLGDKYSDVVSEDIVINVGGLLTSWNPLSHNAYWKDDDFINPVSIFIGSFLYSDNSSITP